MAPRVISDDVTKNMADRRWVWGAENNPKPKMAVK